MEGESKIYKGEAYNLQKILKHIPVEEEIELKIGARVILCKNLDVNNGLYNGRVGKVISFDENDDLPMVEFSRTQVVKINRNKWEMRDHLDGDCLLESFSQIPLILAWAITIHKTQGMTLDHVVVHGGCFEKGQLYVALSRVRSVEGLHVQNMKYSEIMTDSRVVKFYQDLNLG